MKYIILYLKVLGWLIIPYGGCLLMITAYLLDLVIEQKDKTWKKENFWEDFLNEL